MKQITCVRAVSNIDFYTIQIKKRHPKQYPNYSKYYIDGFQNELTEFLYTMRPANKINKLADGATECAKDISWRNSIWSLEWKAKELTTSELLVDRRIRRACKGDDQFVEQAVKYRRPWWLKNVQQIKEEIMNGKKIFLRKKYDEIHCQ